eukprot:COSAG02_NODE_8176_length_2675_cov_8.580745_3_plen_150_part_00
MAGHQNARARPRAATPRIRLRSRAPQPTGVAWCDQTACGDAANARWEQPAVRALLIMRELRGPACFTGAADASTRHNISAPYPTLQPGNAARRRRGAVVHFHSSGTADGREGQRADEAAKSGSKPAVRYQRDPPRGFDGDVGRPANVRA